MAASGLGGCFLRYVTSDNRSSDTVGDLLAKFVAANGSGMHPLHRDLGTEPALIMPRFPDRDGKRLDDGGTQPRIDVMQGFLDG